MTTKLESILINAPEWLVILVILIMGSVAYRFWRNGDLDDAFPPRD